MGLREIDGQGFYPWLIAAYHNWAKSRNDPIWWNRVKKALGTPWKIHPPLHTTQYTCERNAKQYKLLIETETSMILIVEENHKIEIDYLNIKNILKLSINSKV